MVRALSDLLHRIYSSFVSAAPRRSLSPLSLSESEGARCLARRPRKRAPTRRRRDAGERSAPGSADGRNARAVSAASGVEGARCLASGTSHGLGARRACIMSFAPCVFARWATRNGEEELGCSRWSFTRTRVLPLVVHQNRNQKSCLFWKLTSVTSVTKVLLRSEHFSPRGARVLPLVVHQNRSPESVTQVDVRYTS